MRVMYNKLKMKPDPEPEIKTVTNTIYKDRVVTETVEKEVPVYKDRIIKEYKKVKVVEYKDRIVEKIVEVPAPKKEKKKFVTETYLVEAPCPEEEAVTMVCAPP
jgi:hypothetical protein